MCIPSGKPHLLKNPQGSLGGCNRHDLLQSNQWHVVYYNRAAFRRLPSRERRVILFFFANIYRLQGYHILRLSPEKKHPVLQGASCACAIKPPMAPAESFQIPATQLPDVMGLVDMRAKGPDADLSAKSRSIWELTCFTNSLLEIISSLLLGSRDQENCTLITAPKSYTHH